MYMVSYVAYFEGSVKRERMDKQTTAQVAKALGVTKNTVLKILSNYPALRSSERVGNLKQHLWSEDEMAALRAHLATRSRPRRDSR